jgi:predicted DNA-binding transcriptional regulator AlpA
MSTLTTTEERMLTIDEVARKLGLAVRTVRKWDALNQLPKASRPNGRVVRWRESDIALFIECGMKMEEFNKAKETTKKGSKKK